MRVKSVRGGGGLLAVLGYSPAARNRHKGRGEGLCITRGEPGGRPRRGQVVRRSRHERHRGAASARCVLQQCRHQSKHLPGRRGRGRERGHVSNQSHAKSMHVKLSPLPCVRQTRAPPS